MNEFHRDASRRSGLSARCKACLANYHKTRWPKYREQRKAIRLARIKESPYINLQQSLYKALKRRPTVDPVTVEQLMEIWNQQNGLCALTKIPMTWTPTGTGAFTPTSVSIDRVDNSRAYEADNVRLVCMAVNSFRMGMSDDEMLRFAKAILDTASAV